MSNDMCQADVPASCEASSPGTGSSSERRGEGEWFLLELHHDNSEAEICRAEDLTDEGELKLGGVPYYVMIERVLARQDGVFLREETINGEVYYRECPPPATSPRPDEEAPLGADERSQTAETGA